MFELHSLLVMGSLLRFWNIYIYIANVFIPIYKLSQYLLSDFRSCLHITKVLYTQMEDIHESKTKTEGLTL